jgi:serine/threonine protein phosphatase 1
VVWNVLLSRIRKNKPRIPDGTRIYAVGDVHGRADLLSAVLRRIDADFKVSPIADPIQVFLGDYIDRGPHSREVLDLLIGRAQNHPVRCLKGNHEAFAERFLDDPALLPDWSQWGGADTLLSYGVTPAITQEPRAYEAIAEAFRQALPESHRRFIDGLDLSFGCGDYFFVHAGVRPGIPLDKQRPQDLLGIRDEFLLHEEDFGKVVVHGHTPVPEPDIRPNRINIDTGAYATGRLTCLVLEGDQMSFI